MSSLQQPGAKASKFVGTNDLLDPMMRPFQGLVRGKQLVECKSVFSLTLF